MFVNFEMQIGVCLRYSMVVNETHNGQNIGLIAIRTAKNKNIDWNDD